MSIMLTSDSFRLFDLSSSGSIVVCDEPDGTPTFLPTRSFTEWMFALVSAITAFGFD